MSELNPVTKIKNAKLNAEAIVLVESLPVWEERGWKEMKNTDEIEDSNQPMSGSLQSTLEADKAAAKASEKNTKS